MLRPIEVSDAERDYEAVIQSRQFLRSWEQSGWPEDDFSLADNTDDVRRLVERHQSSESYTYTVSDPEDEQCLGCVYLFPGNASIFERSTIIPKREIAWSDVSIATYFWVRETHQEQGLDVEVLKALLEWLQSEWRATVTTFVTNLGCTQQVALFKDNGLELQFLINDPKTPVEFGAFA